MPSIVSHTLNPILRRHRKVDFYELKASLVYIASSRPVKANSEIQKSKNK